jgi:hypothetical protein
MLGACLPSLPPPSDPASTCHSVDVGIAAAYSAQARRLSLAAGSPNGTLVRARVLFDDFDGAAQLAAHAASRRAAVAVGVGVGGLADAPFDLECAAAGGTATPLAVHTYGLSVGEAPSGAPSGAQANAGVAAAGLVSGVHGVGVLAADSGEPLTLGQIG